MNLAVNAKKNEKCMCTCSSKCEASHINIGIVEIVRFYNHSLEQLLFSRAPALSSRMKALQMAGYSPGYTVTTSEKK